MMRKKWGGETPNLSADTDINCAKIVYLRTIENTFSISVELNDAYRADLP